jgi:hypothetical protein
MNSQYSSHLFAFFAPSREPTQRDLARRREATKLGREGMNSQYSSNLFAFFAPSREKKNVRTLVYE